MYVYKKRTETGKEYIQSKFDPASEMRKELKNVGV